MNCSAFDQSGKAILSVTNEANSNHFAFRLSDSKRIDLEAAEMMGYFDFSSQFDVSNFRHELKSKT